MEKMQRRLPLLIAALATAAGCANSGDSDSGVPTLRVEPADVVLQIENGKTEPQDFIATLTRDGDETDVTNEVSWAISDALMADFDGATLHATGDKGGLATITATLQRDGEEPLSAEGAVSVHISTRRVGDRVPDNFRELFDNAEEMSEGPRPTIAYPVSDTIFPPNLGEFEVHWTHGGHGVQLNLFELSIVTDYLDIRLYTRGTPGIGGSWDILSAEEWALVGSSHAGSRVQVQVRGLNTDAPDEYQRSEPIHAVITNDRVVGGLYYWSPNPQGIYRHDFEQPEQRHELFWTGDCVGCHQVSRDGSRVGLVELGSAPMIVDTASKSNLLPESAPNWDFFAFSPDAEMLVSVHPDEMLLRDAETAEVISVVTTGSGITHPDWSPVADALVYSKGESEWGDWVNSGGSIVTQKFIDASAGFDDPEILVQAEPGKSNYYPSWSPDGEWIIFNRAPGTSYDNPAAELYAVRADGSMTEPIRLDAPNLDDSGGLHNSWPRFAPFVQRFGDGAEAQTFYWFTFSSRREIGVRGGFESQIWMAPFFPERAAAGNVASAPAFRLPSQSWGTSNHAAQWTERVVSVD